MANLPLATVNFKLWLCQVSLAGHDDAYKKEVSKPSAEEENASNGV